MAKKLSSSLTPRVISIYCAESLPRPNAPAGWTGFMSFIWAFRNISERYNPVGEFGASPRSASRIASQLPARYRGLSRSSLWRFTNIVARALVGLGRKPDYHCIVRHQCRAAADYYHLWLERDGPADWRGRGAHCRGHKKLPLALRGRDYHAVALVRFAKERNLYDPVADGLRSAFEYDKTYVEADSGSCSRCWKSYLRGALVSCSPRTTRTFTIRARSWIGCA